MPAFFIDQPFTYFADGDGEALDNGYIYIGTAGLDPESNAISVYWDSALSIPASQPIRTSAGLPDRSGSPGKLYVNAEDYSVTVKDSDEVVVYTTLNTDFAVPASAVNGITQTVDTVAAMKAVDLASGNTIITKGYTTAGDGGGGTYFIQTSAEYGATPDGYIDHTMTNTNVAVLQSGMVVNVKQAGLKGDSTTDDTDAFKNLVAKSEGKEIFLPKGGYVIQEQIDIDHALDIKGESKSETKILCKGTPAKTVQTYVIHNVAYDSATYTSSGDAAFAAAFKITAKHGSIENLRVFAWYDETVTHATPYSSYPLSTDWDVGIMSNTTDFVISNVLVDGPWNQYGLLLDVSQPNGSVDRTSAYHSEVYGRFGLGIIGAQGSGTAPNFADLNSSDTRGAGGASDVNFYACSFHSTDIRIDTGSGTRYVRRFTSDAGGMKISGQVAFNSAKRIQGMRFYGCRFAGFDPDTFYINFANRVEFFGCHSEGRAGGYDTDGVTALDVATDYNGVQSTKNATNLKFFGGEKSGEPDGLTYSDPTNGNLISLFGRDDGNTRSESIIYEIKDSGTWTPKLYGTTTEGSPTYTTQVGEYQRVGNWVTAQCRLTISAKGGVDGPIAIRGLPYENSNVSGHENGCGIAFFNYVTFSGQLTAIVENDTDEIQLYDCTSGSSATRIVATNITDSFQIILSVTYQTTDVVSIA